ncbi:MULTISPECIES: pectinesterase family protein [unclassified Streptomyces]|uniref:pectinesterase family protein n=1 Tax=unclassified Streptomyces TaxID=2593676 RepID=UPI003325DC59
MTSTEQGGLSRRSFLGAAAVVSAVVGAGLGAMIGAAPSAVAAAGADFTWKITHEADQDVENYVKMLKAIRQATSSHQIDPPNGRTVYVTDEAGTNAFTTVDIHPSEGGNFVRLFLRRSDVYLMGWRVGSTDSDGTVHLGSIFTLDANVQLPGSIRTTTATAEANTDPRYEGLENYSALAQQGASRTNLHISPSSLEGAVNRLIQGRGTGANATATAAAAILQIIVALAEAARFRVQAVQTVQAWLVGSDFVLSPTHIAHHNFWATLSNTVIAMWLGGAILLSPELEVGTVVYLVIADIAQNVMLAHHSGLHSKDAGGKLEVGKTFLVAGDSSGDFETVQAAIDAVPKDDAGYQIFIDKGFYNEAISVGSHQTWLTMKGVSGDAKEVVISHNAAHGMINPATGLQYGTQGSATATFTAPDLRVQDLTIQNTFDPAYQTEIDPFETQAVALAAMGDRQIYSNIRLLGRQDTLLVKAPTATDQVRQYFVASYIEGSIDFIFGNATAVIDRSKIAMQNWVGGTVLAPNTDWRKKYGILITHSEIFTNGVPEKTMYLGRPWHNVQEAWPQALVRDTVIHSGIKSEQPWTNMVPEYPWDWARFKEYNNTGAGAGTGTNAPKLTATEAADYTAQKYLAGTDGWNPVF